MEATTENGNKNNTPADPKYLFYLVHEHVDFRLPELESICSAIKRPNCIKDPVYSNASPVFTCTLPDDQTARDIASRSFLIKSVSRLYSQADSFDSLLEKLSDLTDPASGNSNPVHSYLEEGGEAKIVEKVDTFKIDVRTFGFNISSKDQIKRIEALVGAIRMPDAVKVCMKNDLVKHRYIFVETKQLPEEIQAKQLQKKQEQQFLSEKEKKKKMSKGDEEKYDEKDEDDWAKKGLYFGRFICEGQSKSLFKYNLTDRGYIGNTSMDPLLAFVMNNMAQVTRNQLVYDPFIGTGSTMIGAAVYGAYICGADLDYNLIHSRGASSRAGQNYRRKDQTIRNNLIQYGVGDRFVDIMVADFSRITSYMRGDFLFDAIVTDPPYGIREKAKKFSPTITQKNDDNDDDNDDDSEEVTPSSPVSTSTTKEGGFSKYELGSIFSDLLKFAAKHLKCESRLVFWLPIHFDHVRRTALTSSELKADLEWMIPRNKHLDLVVYSEQRLSMNTSRLLVTMSRNHVQFDSSSERKRENKEDKEKQERLNQFRDQYFKTFSPKAEINTQK